jgi:hypothetical protein
VNSRDFSAIPFFDASSSARPCSAAVSVRAANDQETRSRFWWFVSSSTTIDNRCDPAAALRLLEGSKIHLSLPQCVFVLGVNVRQLEQAIAPLLPGADEKAALWENGNLLCRPGSSSYRQRHSRRGRLIHGRASWSAGRPDARNRHSEGSGKCLSCRRVRCLAQWSDAITPAGDHSGIQESLAALRSTVAVSGPDSH